MRHVGRGLSGKHIIAHRLFKIRRYGNLSFGEALSRPSAARAGERSATEQAPTADEACDEEAAARRARSLEIPAGRRDGRDCPQRHAVIHCLT